MAKELFNNYIHLIEKDPLQNFVPNTMINNKTARLSFRDRVERLIMVEEMQDLMFPSWEVYYSHKKSNRQKLVDKIDSLVAKTAYYSRRFGDKVVYVDFEGWESSDIKNRSKKSVQKKQRSRQAVIAKMKITGFPIEIPESVDVLSTLDIV